MKIRTDFVTNSSSSSFVISISNDKWNKSNILSKIVQRLLLRSKYYDSYDDVELIESKDQLEQYIMEYYSSNNEPISVLLKEDRFIRAEYSAILKEIESGKLVIVRNVSYHDQELRQIISELEKEDYLRIIAIHNE